MKALHSVSPKRQITVFDNFSVHEIVGVFDSSGNSTIEREEAFPVINKDFQPADLDAHIVDPPSNGARNLNLMLVIKTTHKQMKWLWHLSDA